VADVSDFWSGQKEIRVLDPNITACPEKRELFAQYLETGATIDFSVAERTVADDYLINDLSLIKGVPTYTITVAADQAFGTYKLAQRAGSFTGTLSVSDGSVEYGSVTVNGEDLVYNGVNYSLDQSDGNLTLTITAAAVVPILSGSTTGVSWENISGSSFVVEYSHNDFADTLRVETENNALDTFNMPAGTYQWRVKAEEGEFVNGEEIVSDNASAPQKFVSEADGNMDLFFARASGIWERSYVAQHLGSSEGWEGTFEQVVLSGKNQISDVFAGSTDANILALTDDANGDALFVDDVYTALGDQARIAQIDEIRAGAGDDIVDMTSQRYAYTGDGVKIYGGLGNDTIWANKGNNTLFGDAGNDRLVGAAGNDVIAGGAGNDSMHGGGGSDIFTFGGAWGDDTIEQLADGSVTLWFADGSEANWNAESLTYSDGVNSVSVSGCVNVTLRFGSVPSLPAGAFADAASEKIFEDKNSGMLA
jgi:Ca2+-binding RTX toxin-like protein